MRATKRLTDHKRAWESPAVSRFKITDEEVAGITAAASPDAELVRIYNARAKFAGPPKAAK